MAHAATHTRAARGHGAILPRCTASPARSDDHGIQIDARAP